MTLIEQLEAGETPDTGLFRTAMRAVGLSPHSRIWRRVEALCNVGAYESAVKALQEEVLPGWRWSAIRQTLNQYAAFLSKDVANIRDGYAPTEAAARLAALLRAYGEEGV